MHRVACLGRRSSWGCVNVTPKVNTMSMSYDFGRVELLLPGQQVVSCEETGISREALCFTECRSHSGVYRCCRCINLDLWLRHESDVLAQCETTRVLHHQSRAVQRDTEKGHIETRMKYETRFFQTCVSFLRPLKDVTPCHCLFHSGQLGGVSRASQSVKGFGNFPSSP